jgi:2'-5' RNA ligase
MRCFIAAWPDSAARRRCAELIEAVRPHADHGRATRPENLHLTLAFIGELADAEAAAVAAACAGLAPAPRDWRLDVIGFFARPRVLWAGGTSTPDLDAIAAAARALLDRMNVRYDRKPFVPHVTLLRDVRRFDGPTAIAPPIAWCVDDVGLYRSGRDERGARYLRVDG